jgi:hypothetical protein
MPKSRDFLFVVAGAVAMLARGAGGDLFWLPSAVQRLLKKLTGNLVK